uniref:Uncharacterized protein n=1 Tax=Mycena chlorophos TaxID=658473 RepID=A0ABQ0L4A1_MYCCL|nr:predicted protein [Mycena chlorophos]
MTLTTNTSYLSPNQTHTPQLGSKNTAPKSTSPSQARSPSHTYPTPAASKMKVHYLTLQSSGCPSTPGSPTAQARASVPTASVPAADASAKVGATPCRGNSTHTPRARRSSTAGTSGLRELTVSRRVSAVRQP